MQSPTVTVSVHLPVPVDVAWDEIARLENHVEWMADAASLRFLGDRTRGVGTEMEVETRVGPLRTSDVIEFTLWDPPHRMMVRHRGLFTGHGEFILSEAADGATRFTWREQIDFPWFLGGPVGARAAQPMLTMVWKRNLRRLRARFTDGTAG